MSGGKSRPQFVNELSKPPPNTKTVGRIPDARVVRSDHNSSEVSQDILQATGLGARLAARHRRSAGQADVRILRGVVDDMRDTLEDEGLDRRQVDNLLTETRRAIGQVLAEDDRAILADHD